MAEVSEMAIKRYFPNGTNCGYCYHTLLRIAERSMTEGVEVCPKCGCDATTGLDATTQLSMDDARSRQLTPKEIPGEHSIIEL